MTYNVLGKQFFKQSFPGHPNDADRSIILSIITRENPDILVIQEAPTAKDNQLKINWINDVKKTCNFSEVYIGDVDGGNTLNVFSKYQFDKYKFVTNTGKNGLFGLRQVFLGRLDNLNITFVGMHATHGWKNLGDLELAVNNSDGLFDDRDFQDVVIWAGDFNRSVGDFQIKDHGKYGPFSGSHKFNTCTDNDQKNRQYRTPSDFILHKGIGVQTQNPIIIVRDAVGSDHAPVVSVFDFKPG